ncbi:hypothetical protein [Urbifossiella limnaea]|uniref:Uncharacterized protein n=1 Tax=Urbifossiella limnaea TaxID=2528023 RepID=A0A517XLX5_9BACT|nr:hypothetical protein [Urbifossiella limnaea]QDU18508.1 hypothetical protein ETAA1_03980 [Urbifossiella limnaea]
MSRYAEDDDDRPRRRRRGARDVPCPKCGSEYSFPGLWPWYLGTVGLMFCRAVVCADCGHEFDAKKPSADLPTRKRNLAIGINGCGLLGILAVFGLLALWLTLTMKR